MALEYSRDALAEWFKRRPGSFVLEAECASLDAVLPNLFGYHLLQVGALGTVDLTRGSRILDRHVLSIDKSQERVVALRAQAHELPIQSDSIDVVLLPHVLEFDTHAHDTLREVQRVLVAEGHVILTGFNPWSMCGLWSLVLRRQGRVPWNAQFLSLNRIKDWLALLGFDVERIDSVFYRPPLRAEKMMKRLQFMETLGRRVGGSFAGSYVIVAKKRVSTLTPIRPKWSSRRRLVSVGIAEPTARVVRSKKHCG